MMPTAQKPLIIGDENLNPNSSSNFCLNETNSNLQVNLQTSSNQSNSNLKVNQSSNSLQNKNSNSQSSTSSSTKSTDLNGSLNDKNSQISQKIFNDLTNNNIIDCLSKNSKSKDPDDQFNQTASRDSQISQVNSTQSSINSSINLGNSSSAINDQKSKHKKFVNDKSRDSSSSNGSLFSDILNNSNSLINQSVSKEEQQPIIKWKYSKTHQKRFKRRFPTIEQDEQLIDWFSCALIADILLQGYLYISENYFAFYSNIFGYKTHVLIKVSDVHAISKEKTAKIFPNAVGIHTKQNKFVFGSLLSRESTFKLLNEVRNSYLNLNREKTTTDFSEDDLLDNSLKLSSTLKNERKNDSSNGEMISLKEFKDINLNKKYIHSEEQSQDTHLLDTQSENHHLEHVKFDSLRRHRRSSSLRSSIKESESDLNKKFNQTKLLKANKFVDLNSIILKLSSIKSVLRADLKGSKSSFLIISIAFLLFLLLISISVLIIRINSAHDKLITLSKYSHSMLIPEIDLFNEMFKMIEVMKANLNEISQLKSKLN